MKEERFFYAPELAEQEVSPSRGDLEGSEANHALRVLRLGVGDEIRLMDEVLKEYGDKTATELVDIVHKENTLWYQIAKEKGLLEPFRNHECNNSDYVIDFTKAMLPCAADYYREALAIHNASNSYSTNNV